jgi:KDO2-lipid IV(A) lauroyltransferase
MSPRGDLRNLAEYAVAGCLLKALEWLPLPLARSMALGVGWLLSVALPRWRRVACRNLALALPGLSEARRQEIVRGVFEHLGRVLLVLGRAPRLNHANVREWIDYEGFEHYERALKRGRGVLFLTGHLGNWELSAMAHALLGNPMHVAVRPLDNPYLDRWLQSRRTQCGNREIRKQDFARAALRALRSNEAVGVLIDQNTAGEDGLFVNFFGHKARSTSGLAKIAMRSGATVIPGFALWNPAEGRYVLRFYPPLEMVTGGNETANLLENTQRCQAVIEQVIRQYPEQWLWIHRRWKTRPEGEMELY